MKLAAIFAVILLLLDQADAQDWPDKIRGYKVHDAKVKVVNSRRQADKGDKTDAYVKLADPTMAKIGLFGVTLEIGAEITAMRNDGEVEFLTFHKFHVGGMAVEIDEYQHPFSLKKEKPIELPAPVSIYISHLNMPRAAYNELFEKSDDLAVTGTVFVFGKFKKFGFNFKRVIPIRIDLKIKNPLRP
jgi:hypothetical protein